MTIVPTHLTRLYLAEYSRRPVNLALLVLVPLIFVVLAAGQISDFAKIVGATADPAQLAAPTAGWAAAFLAGVAGLFHVLGSRNADRRLAIAGMSPLQITAARLGSGIFLALLAAGASVAALAFRTGISDPARTIAGTVMFAVIYLGLGVAIGSMTKSDVNGSLLVIFIWMLDVFLGPAMAGSDIWITRLFPSHYVTLVMLDTSSGHSGPIGDLGWAVLWTTGSLALAATVFTTATTKRRNRGRANPRVTNSSTSRVRSGLRYGLIDYRRNATLWVLLVVLPIFFISLSFYITPASPAPVQLTDAGVTSIVILSMIDVHGAIMVPITVAFLAGLSGLFIVQGSIEADSRLAIAGFRPTEILLARLGTIGVAAALATIVSLGVTAIDFTPESWGWFGVGTAVVAATYGLIGVLVGSMFGRLGGLYLMFLVPFIDVGIAQNIMFSASPPAWGVALPARGAVQVLIDGAFTPSFDQLGMLVLSFAWLIGLTAVTATVFHRIARPERT